MERASLSRSAKWAHAAGAAPREVVRYLAEQFPAGQTASLAANALIAYALLGRVAGDMHLDGAAAVAACVTVLLYLQFRLTDDIATYLHELGGPDVIPARPWPLALGVAGTTVAIVLLEQDGTALAAALAGTLLMVACIAVLSAERGLPISRFVAQVPFLELVPAMITFYVCVKWNAANPGNISTIGIVAVVSWNGYQLWKFSRHMGDEPRERIYRLRWRTVRAILVGLLALSLGLSIVLYAQASLLVAFLVAAAVLSAVFAALVWPRAVDDRSRPWWAGLILPAVLLALLVVQLVALA